MEDEKESEGDHNIKTPDLKFEKYERKLGLHMVHGVKVQGKWWTLRQMQYVNGEYTQHCCMWYSQEEIKHLLEEEAELIDSGTARIEKKNGFELMIASKNGMDYFV